jgi:hypothetical protein
MRVRDIRQAQRVVQRIAAKEPSRYHYNLGRRREIKGRFTRGQKLMLRILAIILTLIWVGLVSVIIIVESLA